MNIVQSIENAREENVGSHGIGADVLKTALTRAESALEWIRARHADRTLPLLRLPETHADLEVIRDTARQLADRATDIVILGTGGSSLGGQTLAQLAGFGVPGVGAFRPPPQLHFIDNLDPDSFETLLARLPHATTRFVAISKSGGTAETLMQTIAALSALREAGLQTRIPDIFLGISEPSRSGKTNGLRDLLGKFRIPMLPRHRCRRALFSADECWVAAGSDARSRHCSGARRRGYRTGANSREEAGDAGSGSRRSGTFNRSL